MKTGLTVLLLCASAMLGACSEQGREEVVEDATYKQERDKAAQVQEQLNKKFELDQQTTKQE